MNLHRILLMGRFLKYFVYILYLPLWWIQLLIPRKKNIWVFGAWNGYRFSDNSRYLYQYVRDNHPEIRAIWLTRDKNIKAKIRQNGGSAYLTRDLKAIYYSLLAKNVMFSSGKKDVNYLTINGANLIQLWHGSPLKKIGLDDKYSNANSFLQRKIISFFFPFIYGYNYHYTLSNASVFTEKMASAFNIPLSDVWETGCPRNDTFLSKEEDSFNQKLRDRFKGSKLIYYLPTFRNHENSKSLFSLPGFSIEQLEIFLERHNYVLVSKGHYIDNQLGDDNILSNGRFLDLADEEIDEINHMLKDADALITDYSSTYFDFLLTNKPLIFAAFDLEEYLSGSREMYFDYYKSVAGPIVKDWEELYGAMKLIFKTPLDNEKIVEKNKMFNKYHDANNSKRVFQAIAAL